MKVHFLGIGGSGASAAAAIAQAQGDVPAGTSQGFEVTGCDLEPHNEFTTKFKESQLLKGHDLKHLDCNLEGCNVDILAVTPAIFSLDPNNPELLEAKKLGIPIMTWQQFVGEYLTKDKFVIVVCGTHGKTTTTAMIGQILEDANLDPTVLLGAIHPKWGANFLIGDTRHSELDSESIKKMPKQVRHDKKKYFVMEADEFNDNFLHLKPNITVVTNIEMDHPEYFKDFEVYKMSFKKFLESTKQIIVANLSDPVVQEVLTVHPKGVNTIIDYSKHLTFRDSERKAPLIDFSLQIPGEFNKWNASAAYQVGLILRLNPQIIQKSLATYSGIGRRFEYIGKFKGAEIYSDFGHHPTEIKVTMEAAREKFPDNRIILIYEPHMFSRTKFLFDDFVKVFKSLPVDKIIITDIYPSREMDTGLVRSQQLVNAIHSGTIMYQSMHTIKSLLEKEAKKDDILFFMGAGDIDKVAKALFL